jgi:hypothetical protein
MNWLQLELKKFNGALIGSGDIACALNPRQGAIFFASGVSDSKEKNKSEFLRERELLHFVCGENTKNYCLFYFSTLSINFVDTPYTRHKNQMEGLVKTLFTNYNILRIGNITFGTNPNTFINYFRNCIEKGLPYQVRDEWKYLITKKELLLLTDNLPLTGKNEISAFGRIVKVQQVVNELRNEISTYDTLPNK